MAAEGVQQAIDLVNQSNTKPKKKEAAREVSDIRLSLWGKPYW